MKQNSEIKIKILECNSQTNFMVLQTDTETFTTKSKKLIDFIKTASLVRATAVKKPSIHTEVAKRVLLYLNKIGNRNFPISDDNLKLIIAKLNQGESPDTLERIIDLKSWEWKDKYDMKKFVRPITLFGGKFESYKQELQDIERNPTAFQQFLASKNHESRFSNNSAYDPLDAMPDK